MSEVLIEIKKYGQITKVIVDGKEIKSSAMTVKATGAFIRSLLETMEVENWEVKEHD